MTNESFFNDMDAIIKYTCQQAEDDGVLFNVTKVNPLWKKRPINYVTMNLMSKGYLRNYPGDDYMKAVNVPNLVDLLDQSLQIIRKKTEDFTKWESFFDGFVELPNGDKQMIFIQANEQGKFTVMLPEDF